LGAWEKRNKKRNRTSLKRFTAAAAATMEMLNIYDTQSEQQLRVVPECQKTKK
jgi:hypothetical protein